MTRSRPYSAHLLPPHNTGNITHAHGEHGVGPHHPQCFSPTTHPLSLPPRNPYAFPQMHRVLDEGYSGEETRSQADSDMICGGDLGAPSQHLTDMVLALPPEQRKALIEAAIRSLPSADKDAIAGLCAALTHFDPATYLPNELMLSVLSYLPPRDLLTAGAVSRAWRERALDEKLWRACFAREGWVLDRNKLDAFEELALKAGRRIAEGGRRGMVMALKRRGSKKRKTEEAFGDAESPIAASGRTAASGDAPVGNQHPIADNDDVMEGVETYTPPSGEDVDARAPPEPVMSPRDALVEMSARILSRDNPIRCPNLRMPTLWRPGTEAPKLSWPYIYKQRARLERNWEDGKFTMFQLPDPRFPEEGHTECVYAIQHTSRHLVSGSRDRTIRIWNMDTYRLKREPLRGHDASVLCLQFDERPEHDIIVSGGSDNHVIIWKFSTGEMVKKMTTAHTESVLNLRFDDRYIVTCSKDKTVKVWNRHALHRNDPVVPTHLLPTWDNPFTTLLDKHHLIPEHTLLVTFLGHQAAVNAVMIHDNTIISASGDRTIKSWNIDSGRLNRTYTGHTKGIACVQFDGRRIVSGSSDETVRIFDAHTTAEVACLSGHSNLVRTVQARFGDLDTVTDQELEDEARETDKAFYKALEMGMQPPAASRRPSQRNAGSSKPEEVMSVGTKVPPGGGGSRWAKIVSGSYDETVIIWKRDRDGRWYAAKQLSQDLLRNTARRRPPHAANLTMQAQMPNAQQGVVAGATAAMQAAGSAQPLANMTAEEIAHAAHVNLIQLQHAHSVAQAQANGQPVPSALQNPAYHAALAHAQAQAQPPPAALVQAAQAHGSSSPEALSQQTLARLQALAHVDIREVRAQVSRSNAPGPPGAFPAPGSVVSTHIPIHNHGAGPAGPPTPAPTPAAASTAPPPPPQPQHQHQPPQNWPPAGAVAAQHAQQILLAQQANIQHVQQAQQRESNRVFKLQFDARRIVCCSQNKVIVGWDFANGDRELERVGEWSVETS